MPYTKNNAPEMIQGLPEHAQAIWIAAFNSANESGKSEKDCMQIAWSAVEQKYRKDESGNWIARQAEARSFQRGEIIALADGTDTLNATTRTIQVLRAGTFYDMHGTEVEVSEADLSAYVANSNALIGMEQVPVELGHPIDPGAPAAAWYKRFFQQAVNGVEWVCAEIELTTLGVKSLSDQLYKYFSANLDLGDKVIVGGGFVNRPAVKGQQPVGALAEYLYPLADTNSIALIVNKVLARLGLKPTPTPATMQAKPKGGEIPMTEQELEAKLAEARDESRKVALAQQAEFEAKLAEARKQEREAVLAEAARKNEIAELSAQLTSGTRQFPHKADELTALFAQLSDADRKIIAPVFLKLQEVGLAEMGERGSAVHATAKELPANVKPIVNAWLAGKNTLAEFFAANPELGAMTDYNLAEFQAK